MLHSIWHSKSRLFAQCVVANPRGTFGYRCGLRLALRKNPSALNLPSRMQHYASSPELQQVTRTRQCQGFPQRGLASRNNHGGAAACGTSCPGPAGGAGIASCASASGCARASSRTRASGITSCASRAHAASCASATGCTCPAGCTGASGRPGTTRGALRSGRT